jgi:hypothetical protein
MTSVLRTLQNEWNDLVPVAQARGIRRVRHLNDNLLETISYRRTKLEWLRSQIGMVGSFQTLTFGVELECMPARGNTMRSVALAITQAGVACDSEMYNHSIRTHWKIVTDASVPGGFEVVSPELRGEDGFAQLRKVCDVLTSLRCRVNRSCGFHVHVGAVAQPLSFFKNLIKLYASAEDAIDSFMSPSRRASANTFCGSLKARINTQALDAASTVGQVARAIRQNEGRDRARHAGRYCKLNLQSFWQHGTVEFRQHQGTVEASKAENWVRLCLRMCLTAAAGEKTVASVDELLTAVEASDVERSYFSGRVTYFNNLIPQRRTA